VGFTDERENMSEEREGFQDEVEAHGLMDAPFDTEKEKDDEGPDVEGHAFLDAPNLDAPNAD